MHAPMYQNFRIICLVALIGFPWATCANEPASQERGSSGVDFYGDPLPEGAVARLGRTKFRHPTGTNAIAFSPRGGVLASACIDRIRFWDVSSGRMIREFTTGAEALAFSPDGTRLVSGTGTIRVWDVSTGRQLFAVEKAHRDRGWHSSIPRVAWSPDGRWFATIAGDDQLHLWNAENGSRIRSLKGSERRRQASGFALSGDGRFIAASWQDEVHVWDLQSSREPRIIAKAHPWIVSELAFHPDGNTLISAGHSYGCECQIRLWDFATGEMIAELMSTQRSPDDRTHGLAVGRDGALMISSHARRLRFWDVATRELIRTIDSSEWIVGPLALAPDERLMATSPGNVIRLWETETGRELFAAPGTHMREIRSLDWSPDGKSLITGSWEGWKADGLCLWDPATGELRQRFDPKVFSSAFTFSLDGRILATTGQRLVQGEPVPIISLWDARTAELVREMRVPSGATGIAFSPDARQLTIGLRLREHVVAVYDVETGAQVAEAQCGGTELDHLSFLPDGKSLLYGVHGLPVYRWDFTLGDPPRQLIPEAPRWGSVVAISADGRWLGIGHVEPERLELVDLSSGKTLWECPGNVNLRDDGPINGPNALEFSGDGRLMVARGPGAQGEDIVIEVRTGRVVRRLPSADLSLSRVSAVDFSPDGTQVVSSAGDGTALIWDLRTLGAELPMESITGHENHLWNALADADAGRAYDAVWALSTRGDEAVAFLEQRLKPTPRPDEQHVRDLIRRLDDDNYEVRRNASRELRRMAHLVQEQLQEASHNHPSRETQQRCKVLLSATGSSLVSHPEELCALRAVAVLERIDTPQARRVLKTLSQGAPGSFLTEEAKTALRAAIPCSHAYAPPGEWIRPPPGPP